MTSALGTLVRYMCTRGLEVNLTKHISEDIPFKVKNRLLPFHAYYHQEGNIMPRRTLQVLETTCSILQNDILTHISSDTKSKLSVWPKVEKFCIRSKLTLLRRLNQ